MLSTFQIFGYDIAMYGLLNLIGIIVAIFIARRICTVSGIEKEDAVFASMHGIIGVVVGGKVLYLLINIVPLWNARHIFVENPEMILGILSGGFVFYGGLIGGLWMIYYYCHRYSISIERMLFTLVPVIPFIHGFGRLGCFFAGCCYGIQYTGPLHVVFHHSVAAPNGVELFPVQLLEAGFNFLIFFLLIVFVLERKSTLTIICTYGMLYAMVRFSLEFLRGDVERGFFMGFSTSQWISIAIFLLALILFLRNKKYF